jgi:MFS family permease
MPPAQPTSVRHQIIATATLVAFLMYLDRICLAEIIKSDSFMSSINLTQEQKDLIKGSFFWAYALAQVPAGWLSDRYGTRFLISLYIAAWSLFTLGTGFCSSFVSLMLVRFGCGLAEAGYYPASSGLMTRWAHIGNRGLASAAITWGGRVGGALAPMLTIYVIVKTGDWRWAGWFYGGIGLFIAWLYWHVFRDHPREHPRCNEAETALLAEGRGTFQPEPRVARRFPLAAAWRSGNLWMCNGLQFFTNIGWAFLVLTLGDYLKHVLHADDEAGGTMTTVALAIGIIGMPVGGWLTDYLSRRHGIRPGRMLPMSVSKFTAAGLYLMALTTRSSWVAAIWFGLATFFADLGLPALWTAMQDISGRYQAQLFAWSNMWGNFGAAIQPVLFTAVLESFDTNRDYHEGVWLCAAAFVIAGLFALGVDVEKPAVREAA